VLKIISSILVSMCVSASVRRGHSSAKDYEIERLMMNWLRLAKDRDGGRRERQRAKDAERA